MINHTARLVRRHKFFAFLIVMLICVSLLARTWQQDRQVNYVSVTGDLTDGQKYAVEKLLVVRGSQLSDIGRVKSELESVSWINNVQVTLNWPDEISVQVVPEEAIAYWNDNAFVSSTGKVFESEYLSARDLPQLYGPHGKEQSMMVHYQRLNTALRKSGQFIKVLSLNERGSLQFENQFGVQVSLGNVDIEQRLKRFIRVSNQIALHEVTPRIRRIDTRYPNGVAVEFAKSEQNFEIAETL